MTTVLATFAATSLLTCAVLLIGAIRRLRREVKVRSFRE